MKRATQGIMMNIFCCCLYLRCFPALLFNVGLQLPVFSRAHFLISDLACLVCNVQIKVVAIYCLRMICTCTLVIFVFLKTGVPGAIMARQAQADSSESYRGSRRGRGLRQGMSVPPYCH